METEVLPNTASQSPPVAPPETAAVPRLENGDRLTRSEFERRYEAMPEVKKAELIEGVVYMGSPVRTDGHGEQHGWVMCWVGIYCAATPGVRFADNNTVRLDIDNEPQPDASVWIDEACGGQAHVSADGYLEDAPELIVEVAASSVSYDLHDKLKAYRRNGVKEYVVWRVFDRQVDWFRLEEERYVNATPDAEGIIESRVLPGLRLDVNALVNGDLARVLAAQQRGLTTPEHAAFVERLAAAKAQPAADKSR
jgi:Uma2 family endonuclease